MDTLIRVLFEDPWPLYVALGVAEGVVGVLWYRRRMPRLGSALLAGPVLAGLAALTAHAVVTDREQIADTLARIALHVEAGDMTSVGRYLDADCRGRPDGKDPLTKAQILDAGRRTLKKFPVTGVQLTRIVTTVDRAAGSAVSDLYTTIFFRNPMIAGRSANVDWRLEWAERPAGWRITAVSIVAPAMLTDWRP